MPVLNDTAAQGAQYFGGGTTAGQITVPINANPNALALWAIGAILWTGGSPLTNAVFGMSFGGDAMTQLGANQDFSTSTVRAFQLQNPKTGPRNVVASFSGIGGEVLSRNFMVVIATFSGVQSIGTAVNAGGTSTANNQVTVPSVKPAHKVISVHGAGGGFNGFGACSGTPRANPSLFGGGQLLLQESPGAASVAASAAQQASQYWGAIGVSMAPTIVDVGAELEFGIEEILAAANTYRVSAPSMDRYWPIPADPNAAKQL